MNWSMKVPIVTLLCVFLFGCATARNPQSAMLATLMGSVNILESEVNMRLATLPARRENFEAITRILNESAQALRDAGWPRELGGLEPCSVAFAMHCMDSKCGSSDMSTECTRTVDWTTVGLEAVQMQSAVQAAMRNFETEIVLRFAHAPTPATTQYLSGHIRRAFERVREVRR